MTWGGGGGEQEKPSETARRAVERDPNTHTPVSPQPGALQLVRAYNSHQPSAQQPWVFLLLHHALPLGEEPPASYISWLAIGRRSRQGCKEAGFKKEKEKQQGQRSEVLYASAAGALVLLVRGGRGGGRGGCAQPDWLCAGERPVRGQSEARRLEVGRRDEHRGGDPRRGLAVRQQHPQRLPQPEALRPRPHRRRAQGGRRRETGPAWGAAEVGREPGGGGLAPLSPPPPPPPPPRLGSGPWRSSPAWLRVIPADVTGQLRGLAMTPPLPDFI